MEQVTKIVYPSRFFHRNNDIEKTLVQIRQTASLGLHLGAGTKKIPGLINCDLFDKTADRQIDSTDLGEFENCSVDLIETHHMIEHLSFDEADKAFKEWVRVLKKGGYLIITCPNMSGIAFHWLKVTILCWFTHIYELVGEPGKKLFSSLLIKAWYIFRRDVLRHMPESSTTGAISHQEASLPLWLRSCSEQHSYALKMIYGSQEHDGMFHKSGYDRFRVKQLLTRYSFTIEFFHTPYPLRSTPSLLVIARKI